MKLSTRVWLIEKIRDGSTYKKGERVHYTGSLRNKPTGWRVIKEIL